MKSLGMLLLSTFKFFKSYQQRPVTQEITYWY